MPILLLFVFIPVFWFFIVRPQQQQRRAHQAVVAALAVGDRVMTVGGLIGTLTEVGEETVRLDTGGSELTFGRTFVRQLMPTPDPGALVTEAGTDVALNEGSEQTVVDQDLSAEAQIDLRRGAPDRPVPEAGA